MAPALALLPVLLLSLANAAVDQNRRTESRIVEQPDAPVLIAAYRVEFQKKTAEVAAGLRHDLDFRSRTDQRIAAIQFGLVTFDVWNEFMERTPALAGDTLAPKARDRQTYFTSTDAGVAFQTAVVYVDRVRFESGEIWNADLDAVVAAMRAIQADFNAEHVARKSK